MDKYDDIVTSDLARFGRREMKMARDLLVALCDHNETELLGSDVRLTFNRHSGYVFLCDEDYNVAMVRDGNLEDWVTCGYCGFEGFRDDVRADDDHGIGTWGEILCRGEGTWPVDESEDENGEGVER